MIAGLFRLACCFACGCIGRLGWRFVACIWFCLALVAGFVVLIVWMLLILCWVCCALLWFVCMVVLYLCLGCWLYVLFLVTIWFWDLVLVLLVSVLDAWFACGGWCEFILI